MSTKRIQVLLAVLVVAAGVLVTAVLGMFLYMFATGSLHSDPANLPSITRFTPAKEWADVAGLGRQIMHDALVEQNLPGLSVAVGVGGDIVWAEGSGWATRAAHSRAPRSATASRRRPRRPVTPGCPIAGL